MKIKYIVLFMVICFTFNNCKIKEGGFCKKIKLDNYRSYKIVKIDSVRNVYVIYGEINDTIFKIVSPKDSLFNCKKVCVNESYDLNLYSAFPENFAQKRDKYGIKISGTLIKLEGDSVIWDLFLSKDLKGLCYLH